MAEAPIWEPVVQTQNLFKTSHNIHFPPKTQLFPPSRGAEAHPGLFLPPVPPCRCWIRISQDILRVYFAHGMEDWSNLTWEFPGVFWTYRRATFTRWPVSPREDNWWLGKEVTGTASEVSHQVLEEIRLRNIVRVQDLVSQQKGESFQSRKGEGNKSM